MGICLPKSAWPPTLYFLYWWVFGFYGGQRGGLDFTILLFVFNLEFVSEVALDLAILVF